MDQQSCVLLSEGWMWSRFQVTVTTRASDRWHANVQWVSIFSSFVNKITSNDVRHLFGQKRCPSSVTYEKHYLVGQSNCRLSCLNGANCRKSFRTLNRQNRTACDLSGLNASTIFQQITGAEQRHSFPVVELHQQQMISWTRECRRRHNSVPVCW